MAMNLSILVTTGPMELPLGHRHLLQWSLPHAIPLSCRRRPAPGHRPPGAGGSGVAPPANQRLTYNHFG